MKLGKLGAWAGLDTMTAPQAAAFAKRVESWGYDALWLPEGMGRNALIISGWVLANTTRLHVATGIANIYARDPMAMVSAQMALAEQSNNRFLLGMGVSHVPLVEGVRGHSYRSPVATMRDYLLTMSKAAYMAPPPSQIPLKVIAALGPKMLELAAELADGAHPYNVTPEHTAKARQSLGKGKLLLVEQKIILETDASKARAAARKNLEVYLPLTNYQNNWRRMGFDEKDWSGNGSDRLMDAMFAWGDETAIRKRLQEHWDAGADQVCIQATNADGSPLPDEKALKLLAPTG